MSQRPFVVALCVAVFSGFGCAYGEIREVVRAQFASELDCPEVFIVKRDAWYQYENPNQFKVTGCGVIRSYTCPKEASGRVSYDEPACTWVEGDADAPKMAAPAPMDDEAFDDSEELPPADEAAPDDATEPAPPPAQSDDSADDPTDTDGDLGGDIDGSTDVKPAPKKAAGGGASGQAGGSLRIGVGKKK